MAWIKARNRECAVHTTYGNISGIDGIQFSRVSLNLQVHVLRRKIKVRLTFQTKSINVNFSR